MVSISASQASSEEKGITQHTESPTNTNLKLDKHGLPLNPQPSAHDDDPLNWPAGLKLAVLLQVALLSFIGPMASAVANPAFVPLAAAFGLTPVQASYELAVYILFAGVGPLFVVPFANIYGRRPVYLAGNLLAALANLAAGNSPSWVGVMVTRAVAGIGGGSVVAIGAATICDLFFLHERGFYMGIYTFFLSNGPHLASLVGGFTAQNLGWRYCFTIPAYVQLALFAITVFCLPETLYWRRRQQSASNSNDDSDNANNDDYKPNSYVDLLLLRPKHLPPNRSIHLVDFTRPIAMLRYLCVLLPALYYMLAFSFGSVLFATTGSVIFGQIYRFSLVQTGLMLSVPLLIGSLIGEANAGWFVDWLMLRHARRHDGSSNNNRRPPEPRLDAMWIALLLPVGLVVNGLCVSRAQTTSWVGNAFGMGLANLGLQVASTVVYAYTTDCYKPQSSEISSLLNLFRSIFSAFVSFYAIPLGEKIQFQFAWLVFAGLIVLFMLPFGFLRLYGERLRSASWQRPPTFHNDI